ncbi:MAG: hypothetical protein ACI936_001755 [Paraglaciecola sp.]
MMKLRKKKTICNLNTKTKNPAILEYIAVFFYAV